MADNQSFAAQHPQFCQLQQQWWQANAVAIRERVAATRAAQVERSGKAFTPTVATSTTTARGIAAPVMPMDTAAGNTGARTPATTTTTTTTTAAMDTSAGNSANPALHAHLQATLDGSTVYSFEYLQRVVLANTEFGAWLCL